jgi:hypothetical protein
MTNDEGIVIPKIGKSMDSDDENKFNYDWKAKNIRISSLIVDDYNRKLDAYEGTNDVKQSKINILIQ